MKESETNRARINYMQCGDKSAGIRLGTIGLETVASSSLPPVEESACGGGEWKFMANQVEKK